MMVDVLQVSVRVVMRAHVCQHLRDQRVNWVRFFNKKKTTKTDTVNSLSKTPGKLRKDQMERFL